MNKLIIAFLFFYTCSRSQSLNCYFGNIHAHSSYSDGNKDSLSSGMTTPLQDFLYAKQSNQIDFYGISEHNHYSAGMLSPVYFRKGLEDANTATTDGQFVAMYGMEWGVISSGGHVIVYGFDSLCGWDFDNQEIEVAEADYAKLFSTVNRKTGSFAYLAHPQSNDFSNLFNQSYNINADKAIAGMAMRSGPAFSTNSSYSNPATSNFVSRYNDALKRGYHLGPGIDHDTHNSVFGRQTAGRLVVLAPLLNRAEIYNGFTQRRFYASDDFNVEVNFTIQNLPMGSIITNAGNPTLNVSINDGNGESTTSITVYSGVAGSGNAATQLTSTSNSNNFSYTHNASANLEYYYYLYIVQADGDKIWTAPIWYKRNDSVVIQSPVADFNNAIPVCSNNPIVFEDNSLNTPSTWWWTANGAYPVNSSLQNPTFNFTSAGTYQVSLVVSNQAGIDTISKNIVVQASPVVDISDVDSLCKGGSKTLYASGANTYLWSNGSTDTSLIVSPSINTNYMVTGFVNTCYDTAHVTVELYQALTTPVILANADTLVSSYTNGNQWYFYYSTIAGATANMYLPTLTGVYQVQVSDSAGCKSEFSLPYGVTLGANEIDVPAIPPFKLYPSPGNGLLYVSSNKIYQHISIEVVTLSGYLVHKQLVAECSFDKPAMINLTHLCKGIYIVKLQTADGIIEHKIQLE